MLTTFLDFLTGIFFSKYIYRWHWKLILDQTDLTFTHSDLQDAPLTSWQVTTRQSSPHLRLELHLSLSPNRVQSLLTDSFHWNCSVFVSLHGQRSNSEPHPPFQIQTVRPKVGYRSWTAWPHCWQNPRPSSLWSIIPAAWRVCLFSAWLRGSRWNWLPRKRSNCVFLC